MAEHLSDVAIAGAGIVGLATAYQLLKMKPGLKVRLFEKEADVALHQTGRNSGVVHTGVYYKPESLKAKNCIEGRKELLSFCDQESIPYQNIHKLIVATRQEEISYMKELFSRGQANGIPRIRMLSRADALDIEPNVETMQSLFIPECQIIDYKRVARTLYGKICKMGGEVLFNTAVEEFKDGQVFCKEQVYPTRLFINCAGLYSDRLARASELRILPFRGEYYELVPEKRNLVKGLIYPVPDPKFPFLGVHLTPMINGKVEAGPNAILATAREGYKKTDLNFQDMKEIVSYPGFWKMAIRYWRAGCYEMARSCSKQMFLRDLQRLAPAIREADLLPGGAGIRAQAVKKDGKLVDDFAFLEEEKAIHVLNAPSPAATASFSIGRTIATMALKRV